VLVLQKLSLSVHGQVNFSISPSSLENVANQSHIPDFLIEGHLDSSSFHIQEALTGEVRETVRMPSSAD
jgi:hypothetical protein